MRKKQIDRFTLLESLYEGGEGEVYRAEEKLPGEVARPAAVKILPAIREDDKAAEERFFAQVKLIVDLGGHPNIVTFYGVGMAERTPWVAMEYIATSLEQVITEKPAAAQDVARVLLDITQALSALHGLEVPMLHNDLKPANILVDRFNTCKLTDFTLAGPTTEERTRVLATVRYAAPELLSRDMGKVCPATDLYALGHIGYELALGGKLYRQQFPAVYDLQSKSSEANPARWMAWHCSIGTQVEPIQQLRADFPPTLSDIIAKLMRKPLQDRYVKAGEVLADLQRLSAAPIAAAPPPAAGPAAPAAAPRPPAASRFAAPSAAPPAPAAPGSPAMTKGVAAESYYLRMRGRVSGPFDLATLQRQAKQGLVSRLHQVSTDRINWRSAASVEGLF